MASTTWLAIITGASRGFGRALALEFAAQVAEHHPLHLVLLARGDAGLKGTKDAVEKEASTQHQPTTIDTHVIDLADLDTLEQRFGQILTGLGQGVYERAFFFNNAGSLGQPTRVTQLTSLSSLGTLRSSIDFNVTSSMWLTAAFAKFRTELRLPAVAQQGAGAVPAATAAAIGAEGQEKNLPANAGLGGGPSVIVNVSSLAALQPFRTWGVYCSGKAAREMWHRALAAEMTHVAEPAAQPRALAASHVEPPLLTVFNYGPGPLDTDMQAEYRAADDATGDPELLEAFRKMHREGTLVKPRDSAAKCVRIALACRFEAGAHVDFFDEKDP